jgi:hypothetical protein
MNRKQNKPERIKDPKKVAAGKARAAKGLRIGGRFTPNRFLEEVKKEAENFGVPEENIFQYFLQNETHFIEVFESKMETPRRMHDQVKKEVRGYKGEITFNGRKAKKENVLKKIDEFNQSVKLIGGVNYNVKFNLTLKGEMFIKLPTKTRINKLLKQLERAEEEGEDTTEIINEFYFETGVYIIIS